MTRPPYFVPLPAALMLGLLLLLAPFRTHAAAFEDAQQQWLIGQRAQAMQTLEKALADDPNNARLRFSLAAMLLESGASARAEAMFKQLTEDFPDLADPHNNLAVIYAARGELDAAYLALERAVRLQPEHAQAQENLGDVLLQLAARAYGRAADLSKLPIARTKGDKTLQLLRALGNPQR
ncbi:tetratricopeptide repeat protein [Paucibacter sp. APW11]|uniref:Tetratricopeptide repeat protein n=1 Tax=Roseateles aquae TaxID=3077235 RepID=A0ABU3P9B0_9BURK|nr:tetratricopeptide repeat protein [Paucibacter sp. APW11]MDT8999159.1 tetratricopeptide repeat protein [Paucibacter sp. APW11]